MYARLYCIVCCCFFFQTMQYLQNDILRIVFGFLLVLALVPTVIALLFWFRSPKLQAHQVSLSIAILQGPPFVVRPQYSNIFFSETTWPIKAKFCMELPWAGGGEDNSLFATFGSNEQDGRHAHIWLKPFKKCSEISGPISTKLGM